jgi:hypothetical protein
VRARAALLAAFALALPAGARAVPAAAAVPPEPGLVLSLASGYGWVFGDLQPGVRASDLVEGEIPIQIELAYQWGGRFRLGAFLEIAPTLLKAGGCSGGCNASSLRVGLDVAVHAVPDGAVDPWFGVGIGGEGLWAQAAEGGAPAEITWSGFLLPIVEAGLDFRVSQNVRIGPWVTGLFGEYTRRTTSTASPDGSITPRSWHEWLRAGLRVTLPL